MKLAALPDFTPITVPEPRGYPEGYDGDPWGRTYNAADPVDAAILAALAAEKRRSRSALELERLGLRVGLVELDQHGERFQLLPSAIISDSGELDQRVAGVRRLRDLLLIPLGLLDWRATQDLAVLLTAPVRIWWKRRIIRRARR